MADASDVAERAMIVLSRCMVFEARELCITFGDVTIEIRCGPEILHAAKWWKDGTEK